MIKTDNLHLCSEFGKSDEALDFIQTVMYSGLKSERFVETRIRLYNKQKVKSSISLIPDIHSATQHVYIVKQGCGFSI